jgi:hypothetical protein
MKFMNRNLTVLLTTGVLIGALSAGLAFAGAPNTIAPAPPTVAPAPRPGNVSQPSAIYRAIKALEAAKLELQQAGNNFGGHKAAALKACDQAIKQLELAMETVKK